VLDVEGEAKPALVYLRQSGEHTDDAEVPAFELWQKPLVEAELRAPRTPEKSERNGQDQGRRAAKHCVPFSEPNDAQAHREREDRGEPDPRMGRKLGAGLKPANTQQEE
jgi:hypothetical protein